MDTKLQNSLKVAILDTGLSNLQSVINWLGLGFSSVDIVVPNVDFKSYDLLVMPGVGSFDELIKILNYHEAIARIREYINAGGKYLGICLGFQVLFETSSEGSEQGLGIFPYRIERLNSVIDLSMPHAGFSCVKQENCDYGDFYFIHSYGLIDLNSIEAFDDWVITNYGGQSFVSFLRTQNVIACQFHPEKSATAGIEFLKKIKEWL